MDVIIDCIRRDLKAQSDPKIQKASQHFFKDAIMCYGLKTATVTTIAKKYWKLVKNRDKEEIFRLCEELYKSGYIEETFIVSNWIYALSKRFEKNDLSTFQRFIGTYITNWASCDSFCNHAMGDYFERFPDQIDELKRWTRSGNRWVRRAAAVSLIVPAKHGKFLDEVFAIADLLLTDKDDMVQKGYGWLLKEASRLHQDEVFNYVLKHRRVMPRTALRYAIELMPKDLKTVAMKKD